MMSSCSRRRRDAEGWTTELVYHVNKARVWGICDWIFEDNLFRQWRNQPTAEPIIWVYGPVGSGKTMLMERVRDVVRESSDVPTVGFSCYASCTPFDMLQQILSQLAYGLAYRSKVPPTNTEAAKDLYFEFQKVPRDRWAVVQSETYNAHAAWDMFEKAVAAIPSCNLFVDGLDVLSEKYHSDDNFNIAKRLEYFVKHKSNGWRLYLSTRASISNRTSPSSIHDVFQSYPSISLTGEKMNDGMRQFAVSRIHQHSNLVPFEAKIVDWLVSKAEGIFIWAALAVQALSKEEDLPTVIQRLDNYSAPLDDLYPTLMTVHCQSRSSIDIRIRDIILAWVLNSVRPLSLAELGNAIYACDSIYVTDVAGVVAQTCGPLLKIEADKVVPVHPSLRDFVSSTGIIDTPWIDSIRGTTAHQLIGTACLRYITQLELSNGLLDPINKDDVKTLYPLLEYATLYWTHHFCAALPLNPDLSSDVVSFYNTKNAFNWAKQFLPMFLSDSVLDVPPQRKISAPIAYLFHLRSQIIGSLPDDPDRRSNFERTTSESLVTHYKEVLARSTRTALPGSTLPIRHMLDLGEVYGWIQGGRPDSEQTLTAAYHQVITRELLDSASPESRFLALSVQHTQAESLKRAGRYSEALHLLQHLVDGYDLLALSNHYHPNPHPSTDELTTTQFFALDALGWTCARLSLHSEAADHLALALSLNPNDTSPTIFRTKTLLAEVLLKLDRAPEAESLCDEIITALAAHRATTTITATDTDASAIPQRYLSTLPLLASVYTTQGKHSKAIETYEILRDVRARGYGRDHPMALWAEMQLGLAREKILGVRASVEDRNGREQLALFFEALVRRQIAVLGLGHPDVRCCREAVGRLRGEEVEVLLSPDGSEGSEGWEVV